jgi:hypothetical protein
MKINSVPLTITIFSLGHFLMSEGRTMGVSATITLKDANWTSPARLAYTVNDCHHDTRVHDHNHITSIHKAKNLPLGQSGFHYFSVSANHSKMVIHREQPLNWCPSRTVDTMVEAAADHCKETIPEEQCNESIPTNHKRDLKSRDFFLFFFFLFVAALALVKLDKDLRGEEFDNEKPTESEQTSRQY